LLFRTHSRFDPETSKKKEILMRSKSLGSTLALAAALIALPASAQTTLVPLNQLTGGGSLVAGDITFSNFAIPNMLPTNVTSDFAVPLPVPEFGDVAAQATVNADGTVSLSFVFIDPATGQPSPLVVGPDAGGEKFRDVTYTVTVTDPALRLHAIDQAFNGVVITGDSGVQNGLYAVEPSSPWDQLMLDFSNGTDPVRITLFPCAVTPCDRTFQWVPGGILLPGGDLATYNMASAFGFIKGRFGFPPGGSLDSVTETFTLVAAGGPVPLVVPNIANLFTNDSGIGMVSLTDYAQDGGAVVTLASGNPVAQTVPDSVTVPQGYKTAIFQIPAGTVDAPTAVTLTASYNGQTVAAGYTAVPETPLDFAIGQGLQPNPQSGVNVRVALTRQTFAGATIQLSSGNPAVAPVQPSITIPVLGSFGDFQVQFAPVSVDTPVTISATLNGVTRTYTVVVPAPKEIVQVSKAEYVVSKANLKAEATSSNPAASLTLFDGNSGAFIGTMTFSGTSGSGAKFSFQGTVPQIFTLRAVSTQGGTAGVTVQQK
jgi:hypothetical protein